MAGSVETNRAKYGIGFYAVIGTKGGKRSVPKGFAMNRELARKVAALGGAKSKRGHRFIGLDKNGQPQYMKSR
jgi:hypothetical protein